MTAALALQHYDIRPDALVAPRATPSVENGPNVTAKPASASLILPPGFSIAVYAQGLAGPRYMALAPNGDVFVTEIGANRVSVIRPAEGGSSNAQSFVFARGLNQPFGIAFQDGFLYVGETDGIVRYPYTVGQTSAGVPPSLVASLSPGGNHSLRNIIFSADGTKLYAGVGSTSNDSPESDATRASILELNADGSGQRIYASGLRNPSGLAIEPLTGKLWTTVNERDALGDDLVPDYATSVMDGGFYGWPYSYIGRNLDPQVGASRPDLVSRAIVPDLLIQAHSASLGITFYNGSMFPHAWNGDAFVALHGSWNRSRRTGYKVIRIPMQNGQPVGGYDDFVVGWSPDETSPNVWGRPVGLLVLADGSLLISDDGAGVIWRVTYSAPPHRRTVAH
jgi:glucose/arabinose dehydrogenase